MNFTNVLELVESAVYRAKGRKLTDPELAVLRGSWEGLTYEKMAQGLPYKPNYLKGDVSHKFWKLLSEALEEDVSKRNFRAALLRASLKSSNQSISVDDADYVSSPTHSSNLPEVSTPDSSNSEGDRSFQSLNLNFHEEQSDLPQGTHALDNPKLIESQASKEPSHLEKKMRAWFEALGYELIPGGIWQEDCFNE